MQTLSFSKNPPFRSFRTAASSAFVPYSGLDSLFPTAHSDLLGTSNVKAPLLAVAPSKLSLGFLLPQNHFDSSASRFSSHLQTASRSFRRGFRNVSISLTFPTAAVSFTSAAFGARPSTPASFRRSFGGAFSSSCTRPVFYYTPTALGGDFGNPTDLALPACFGPELKNRFPLGWHNGFSSVSSRSPLADLHGFLAFFFNSPVHFTAVNALSLTSFAFNRERRRAAKGDKASSRKVGPSVKTANLFLQQIERERASRFQRAAVRIPDLVRLSFVSVYLKKPQVLANLFATTLAHLPRNRKETQFLRFLRKLVKVFTAQRKERRGVRLRFQGRVNRWRRTKHRQTERGKLNLFTYTTRLEYGIAQAITRKGAIGVRLWFCYHASWGKGYRSSLFSFFRVQSSF